MPDRNEKNHNYTSDARINGLLKWMWHYKGNGDKTNRGVGKIVEKDSIEVASISQTKVVVLYSRLNYQEKKTVTEITLENINPSPWSYILVGIGTAAIVAGQSASTATSEYVDQNGQKQTTLSARAWCYLGGGIAIVLGLVVKSDSTISTKRELHGSENVVIEKTAVKDTPIEISYFAQSGNLLSKLETKQTDYDGRCEFNLPLADIMSKLEYGENLIVKAKSINNPTNEGTLEINYADIKEAFERISPPELYTTADFDDGDGYFPDKVLDATEKSKLKVTVENKGKGIGYDIRLNVKCNEPLVKTTGFNNYLGDIRPKERKTIEIPLQGDIKLPTEAISFAISAEEKNKFDAQKIKIEIRTAKIERPQLIITNVELNDKPIGLAQGNGNGIAETGETIELIAYVKNEGVGKAINANLELVDISTGIERVQSSERLGDIAVGKTVRGKVVVSVPRNYPSSEMKYKLRVSEIRNVGTGEKSATLKVDKQEAMLAFDFIPPSKPLTNNSSGSVQVVPKNRGKLTAKNVVLRVTSSNPMVVISNSVITIGNVNAGGEAISQSIGIALPRTFSENSISLNVGLTQSDFPSYKETKILPVTLLRPNIKIYAEQNRKIKQGEQGIFEISVGNSGTLVAEDVVLTIQNGKIKFNDAKIKNIGKLSDGTTSEMWRIPFMLPRNVVPGPLPIIIEATQKDFPSTSLKLAYEVVEEAAFVTKIEGKKKEEIPIAATTFVENPIISISSFADSQTVSMRSMDFKASTSAEHGIQYVVAMLNGLPIYDSRQHSDTPYRLQRTKGKLLDFEFRIPDLSYGSNDVEIIVYDNENESTRKVLKLFYSPEKLITKINLDPSIDIENVSRMKQGGRNENGVAVVIGIEKYQTLSYALYSDKDASVTERYLIETFGFSQTNIALLLNEEATLSNIRKELFGKKLENRIINGETDLFVFFSGHGFPNISEKAMYIAPYDCDKTDIDQTGIALKEIFQRLMKLKVRNLIVVLDACFSGYEKGNPDKFLIAAKPAVLPMNPEYLGRNGVVFYSSSSDQLSSWIQEKKHSIFTYYFLKGLQGDADADGNGEISIKEMELYLSSKVSVEAHKLGIEQTPQVQALDKARILVKY